MSPDVRARLDDAVERLLQEVGATAVYVVRTDGEVLAASSEPEKLPAGFREKVTPPSLVYDRRESKRRFVDAALSLAHHDAHTVPIGPRAALVVVVQHAPPAIPLALAMRRAARVVAALLDESEVAMSPPPSERPGDSGSGAPALIGLGASRRRGQA